MGAGINSILARGVEPIHIDPFAAQAKALQLGEYYAKTNLQKQQAEEARLKNVGTQRGIDAEAALSKAIGEHTVQDPQTGKPVVDHDAVAQSVAAAGFPGRADTYNIQRRADEKAAIDNQKNQVEIAGKQNGMVGNALQSLTQVPDDQLADAYDTQRNQLIKSIGPQVADHIPPAAFLVSKGGVNALKGFVAQQGAAVVDADKQIAAHQKDLDYALNLNKFHQEVLKEAPTTNEAWLKQGSQILGAAQTDAQWAAGRHNLQAAGAPPEVLGNFSPVFTPDAVAAAQRIAQTPAERETGRHNLVEEAGQAATRTETQTQHGIENTINQGKLNEERRFHNLSTEGVSLTPEAKTKMAEMFATTGQLPSLGMGAAAARQRSDIINEAATKFPQVDFASNKAAYQANTTSLKGLQKSQDAIESFENTAGKNLDQFLTTASKVVDSGSPLVNAPMRTISRSFLGSEQQQAFDTARQVATTEIAKVLNNPSGNAALSDSARKEVEQLIGPNASLKQIYTAANILRTDMKNRRDSGREQIKAIQERIGGKSEGSSTSGTIRARDPQGKLHEAPAGTALPQGWKLE